MADDTDDDFERLVAGIDVDPEAIESTFDYSTMDSMDLAEKEAEIKQELLKIGEYTTLNPATQQARDLHSQRVAIRIELRRRGLR